MVEAKGTQTFSYPCSNILGTWNMQRCSFGRDLIILELCHNGPNKYNFPPKFTLLTNKYALFCWPTTVVTACDNFPYDQKIQDTTVLSHITICSMITIASSYIDFFLWHFHFTICACKSECSQFTNILSKATLSKLWRDPNQTNFTFSHATYC